MEEENLNITLLNKSLRYTFVSLGYFCGVAMELERIGLRSFSLPFDWLISGNFESVLRLIKNNFDDFLDPDFMFQEVSVNKNYYYNKVTDIHFYHDFSAYRSFDSQIDEVEKKYRRRIQRFYEIIQKPTIFIRYIASKNEAEYIAHHAEEIDFLLKSFHPENRIIYIADCLSEPIKGVALYCAKKDKGDEAARRFLEKCPDLKNALMNYSYPDRKANLKRYKQTRKKKWLHKAGIALKKYFCKSTYTHNKNI